MSDRRITTTLATAEVKYPPERRFTSALVLVECIPFGEPSHDGKCCSEGFHHTGNDCAESNNPISLRKGEKRLEATDLSLNTPAGALTFTRQYRQSKQADTGFQFMGLGWTHNHTITLRFDGSLAEVILGSGTILKLRRMSDTTFKAEPGSNSEMTWDAVNSEWTLAAPNDNVYVFAASVLGGWQVETREWANGETWHYLYETDFQAPDYGLLKEVNDGYGRAFKFAYYDEGDFRDGQLRYVGDQDATGLDDDMPAGRYIEFDYVEEYLDGSPVGSRSLLSSVSDVRNDEWLWTYEYYGQQVGQNDSALQNWMTARLSPSMAGSPITLEQLDYTLTNGQISGITQQRGNGLLALALVFDRSNPGYEQTNETIAGHTTTHYFEHGVYAGAENALGQRTQQTPNNQFRYESQQDANGNTTQLAWSTDGQRLEQVTDALNHATQFDYNSDNTLNYSLDVRGRKTEYIYGTTPRQPTDVKVIDSDGTTVLRWQQFEYDAKGRTLVEKLVDPADGTTPLQQTTHTYYSSGDGQGLLWTVTQENLGTGSSETTTYFYDSVGRVVQTNRTPTFGSCQKSRTVYDAAGNVLATLCNFEPGVLNPIYPTTVSEAQTLRQRLYDTNNPDHYTDPDINRLTLYDYDALGRRVKTILNAEDPYQQVNLTLYDALNRVTRVINNYQPQGTPETAPADWVWNNNQWEYSLNNSVSHGSDNTENVIADTAYNDRGLVELRRDVLGSATWYIYDNAGRLVRTIVGYVPQGDPETNPADWVWDGVDQRWERGASDDIPIDHGNNDQNLITEQVYDATGNLVKTVDPSGAVTVTIYDVLNRPIKTLRTPHDPNYDFAGDPDLASYTLSEEPDTDLLEETAYDNVGRIFEIRRLLDARGVETWTTTRYVYDELDRQVRTIANYEPQGSSDPANWVWHTGRWEDGAGIPIQHGNNDQNLITEIAYDTTGRVQETINVKRARTRYIYDGLGRQVLSIVNYIPQLDSLNNEAPPNTWSWNNTLNCWEGITAQPATVTISHGPDNDQNLITTKEYDMDGRVKQVRDVAGKLTRYVYDSQGRQTLTVVNYNETGITHAAEQWTWDATDECWEDGAGAVITHATTYYNDKNIDDLNLITATAYDTQGRVKETRDARGNLTRYVYDTAGRRVRAIANYVPQGGTEPADWVWASTQWEDGTGNPIQHGNNDQNRIAATEYDVAGRMVSTRDTAGQVTRIVYDDLRRRVRTITNYVQEASDPVNWVWANDRWEDGNGSAVSHGTAFDENLIADTAYNRAGQVASTRDARGTQTAFVYDSAGRRRVVKSAYTSPLETQSYTCYNKAGQVLRTIATYVPAYDKNQQSISPDQWLEGAWVFAPGYNDGRSNDQNRIVEYKYDGTGRHVTVTDPVGNVTTTSYDLDGQVNTVTDPAGMVMLNCYDGLRRRTLVVQNYNNTTNTEDPAIWVWDNADMQWEESDGTPIEHGTNNDQNIIVQVAYNILGHRTGLRDPRGNPTAYDYDQLGRRIKLTNPLQKEWVTQYQDVKVSGAFTGETRIRLTDPKSDVTDRETDRLGRLKTIEYGAPTDTYDVTFGYDLAGNQISMAEDNGISNQRITVFDYDAARRLTTVEFDTDGDGTVEETVSYEYCLGGQQTKLTLPGSLDITYMYDAKGRLISLTDWDSHETRFTYDNANRLVATERANGLTSRYRYDAAGRLRLLRHIQGRNTLAHFAYEVDERGNRTQAFELIMHPTTTGDLIYNYDDASIAYRGTWTNDAATYKKCATFSGSLKLAFCGQSAMLTVGTGVNHALFDVYVNGSLWQSFDGYTTTSGERTITLDLMSDGPHTLELRTRAEHSPTAKTDPNYDESQFIVRFKQLVAPNMAYNLRTLEYTYDALSRLTETRYNPGLNVGAADVNLLRRYQHIYDLAGNRLSESLAINGGTPTITNFTYNEVNQIDNAGFTFDDNGNLISDGTNTYTWDRANRLTGMGELTYQYDGASNRIQQSDGVDAISYLLDLQPGLVKFLAATTTGGTDRFVHGPHGIHAQESSAGIWTWPVTDGLGSVRGDISDDIAVNGILNYAPYGVEEDSMGSVGSPFSFTGEPLDDNGLLYLRARYYHPALGVFTALDPLENLNRYQYVGSNPISRVDPTGLQEGCESLVGDAQYYVMCLQQSGQNACPPDWREEGTYNRFCYPPVGPSGHGPGFEYTAIEAWEAYWELSTPNNAILTPGEYHECTDLLTNKFTVDSQLAQRQCQGASSPSENYLQLYPFLSTGPNLQTQEFSNDNRQRATDYAIRYANDVPNPLYPQVWNNCTNFASQVLEAGGLRQDLDWTVKHTNPDYNPIVLPTCVDGGVLRSLAYLIMYRNSGECGRAWVITSDLEKFLIGGAPAHQFDYVTATILAGGDISSSDNLSIVSPGDIVFFHGASVDNRAVHAAAVIGWGPPTTGPRINGKRQLDFTAAKIPWMADNSGPGYIRPINDFTDPIHIVKIVHIPYP